MYISSAADRRHGMNWYEVALPGSVENLLLSLLKWLVASGSDFSLAVNMNKI